MLQGETVGDYFGTYNGGGDLDGDGVPEVWSLSPRKDDNGGNEYSAIDVVDLPARGTLTAGVDSIAQRTGAIEELIFYATSDADLDGDGIADLALGAGGAVTLELGPTTGVADREVAADIVVSGEGLGVGELSSAGDLTGDGLDDVVATASGLQDGRYAYGYGVMVLGLPLEAATDIGAIDRVVFTTDEPATLGLESTAGHDVDGDGIGEVLVRREDRWAASLCGVWLHHGPIDGPVDVADADTTFVSNAEGDQSFGNIYDLHDLDGDGLGEFGLSVNGGSVDAGVWVHGDPASGTVLASTGWAHFVSENVDTAFVNPAVGDLDGDGAADLAVRGFPDDCGNDDPSAVYLAYGLIAGTIEVEALPDRICGADGDAAIGSGMAVLGDTDGDGFDELVVGSSRAWRESPGVAWVFRGAGR